MKIVGVICKGCKIFVFSRAVRDFRYCQCMKVAVDGGPSLARILSQKQDEYTVVHKIMPKLTEKMLYDDWNESIDQYGHINTNSTG